MSLAVPPAEVVAPVGTSQGTKVAARPDTGTQPTRAGRARTWKRHHTPPAASRSTRKLTPLAPIQGNHRSRGVSMAANETRPQVRTPIGQAPRITSTANTTTAVHTDPNRNHATAAQPAAAPAKYRHPNREKPTQANQ